MFGEAEIVTDKDGTLHARVNSCDFTGYGCSCWYFTQPPWSDPDMIVAWSYASEFKRPEFIKHNPHWGEEK